MSWSTEPHVCDLPEISYMARWRQYFTCDECKRQWKVVAQTGPDQYGQYRFWYECRVGSTATTRKFFD